MNLIYVTLKYLKCFNIFYLNTLIKIIIKKLFNFV